MATVSIRVMRGGEPVIGAKLGVGDLKEFTTDADGRVSKTVPSDWGPMCVGLIIQGADFKMGLSPVHLARDNELVIEV